MAGMRLLVLEWEVTVLATTAVEGGESEVPFGETPRERRCAVSDGECATELHLVNEISAVLYAK